MGNLIENFKINQNLSSFFIQTPTSPSFSFSHSEMTWTGLITLFMKILENYPRRIWLIIEDGPVS